MTATALFEFSTEIDIQSIKQQLANIWQYDDGYYIADVSRNLETQMTECYLKYIYHLPEEEEMLKNVARYLLAIAKNSQVIYCSCPDIGYDLQEPVWINIDDIVREPYCPKLSGFGTLVQYIIADPILHPKITQVPASALFEVLTDVEINLVEQKIKDIWSLSLLSPDENAVKIIKSQLLSCCIDKIHDLSLQGDNIKKIADYLLNISKDGQIYYCASPLLGYLNPNFPWEITVDDIIREPYKPKLTGFGTQVRYQILKK
jgi:hypothetical protein